MDLVKAFYSKFIDWDLQLYDEATDTPARASKCALRPCFLPFVDWSYLSIAAVPLGRSGHVLV